MDALITYLQDPETPFGVFDLVYGAYFLFAFIRGIFRGLPEELSQLLGTLLIFWGGSRFYTPVSEFIVSHTRLEEPAASKALAYVLIVLVFLIAWKLLTFLIRKTLDWTCPRQLRRFGGAAVGLLKSAIIVCVILAGVLLSGHQVLIDHMIGQSYVGRAALNILPAQTDDAPDGSGNP
ncbi:MAG: CvpA family protein [Kiritimatiellia bacterium]